MKLKKGDKIVKSIEDYLIKHNIYAGYLCGLGALSDVELMLYDLKNKKYHSMKYSGSFEISSFSAIITKGIEKPAMIHPHIVVSDDRFNCKGGHLKEGVVAATLEVCIFPSDQNLTRYFDKKIGLNLIK